MDLINLKDRGTNDEDVISNPAEIGTLIFSNSRKTSF